MIGLNEVTRSLLERLLREEWVRNSYTVSAVPDDVRCSRLSTLGDGTFGNMVMSKIPPAWVRHVEMPHEGRQSHVVSLHLCSSDPRNGGKPLRVDVCSTHLTAFPWLMEGRRRAQLRHLTTFLDGSGGGGGGADLDSPAVCDADTTIVMGDLNMHREAENASIPEGWAEVPAIVGLGATWDFQRNLMLAHYLPIRNIYNGESRMHRY